MYVFGGKEFKKKLGEKQLLQKLVFTYLNETINILLSWKNVCKNALCYYKRYNTK